MKIPIYYNNIQNKQPAQTYITYIYVISIKDGSKLVNIIDN